MQRFKHVEAIEPLLPVGLALIRRAFGCHSYQPAFGLWQRILQFLEINADNMWGSVTGKTNSCLCGKTLTEVARHVGSRGRVLAGDRDTSESAAGKVAGAVLLLPIAETQRRTYQVAMTVSGNLHRWAPLLCVWLVCGKWGLSSSL